MQDAFAAGANPVDTNLISPPESKDPEEVELYLSAQSAHDAFDDATSLTSIPDQVPDDEHRLEPSPRSYVSHLPVDILGEIFIRCLPPPLNTEYLGPIPFTGCAPMLLCQICRHWRDIALSMTILWSTFSTYPLLPRNGRDSHVAIFKLWLERSDPRPVSFDLARNTSPTIRQLMYANLHRWGSLWLYLDDTLASELVSISPRKIFSVESLYLSGSVYSERTLEMLPPLLRLFPNLRRFTIDGLELSQSSFSQVPWARLTDIELNGRISMANCMTMIGQCTGVTVMNIQICAMDNYDEVPFHPKPATLPHLISLRLTCYSRQFPSFLDALTLPSLRALSFGTCSRKDENSRALSDLMKRSACTLESFRIGDLDLPEDGVIKYLNLPSLHSLRKLQINCRRISEPTLTLLTRCEMTSGPTEGVFPFLKDLHLACIEAPDSFTSDMFASRWRPGHHQELPASLVRVDLDLARANHASPSVDDRDLLRFRQFEEEGLKIDLNKRWMRAY
ncbi:hypothetical protein Hypma_001654 [Hypsizygus marmoreus]|uniref:Uncharacterized protein n=1 Tax=Hypsizygus marmoreus TaxID=39966 RepID=A0A369JCG9_HYPMA|nr:hypothetical protein Hypma_001654 [Hypsizygus marmoreus]